MKSIIQKENIAKSEIAVKYVQSEINSDMPAQSIDRAFDILFDEVLKTFD